MDATFRAATTRPTERNEKTAPKRCFRTTRGSVLPTLCTLIFLWCANDAIAVVALRPAGGNGCCRRVLHLGRHQRLRLIGRIVCEPSTHSWLPVKRIPAVTEM